MKSYIHHHGLQNVTLKKLASYINSALPHKEPLGVDSVRSLLIEQFNIKYGPFNASRYRYEDPNYDEKRLQVCRLLAQFHLEGAIIVSIDESNFKHGALPNHRW